MRSRLATKRWKNFRGVGRVVVVGAIAGATICVFAGLFTWIATSKPFSQADKLDVGLRQILQGDPKTALGIAESIPFEDLDLDADRARHLVLTGYAAWRQSVESLEHREIYEQSHQAVEKLRQARDLGFPPGYEGIGQFALGMSLAAIKEFDEAIESLDQAAKRYPIERSTAIYQAIDSLLEKKPADIDGADQRLKHWRTLPALGQSDLEWSNLAEAKIRRAQGKLAESNAILEKVPNASPAYAESQLLLADQERELALKLAKNERSTQLERALAKLQAINEYPKTVPRARRESMYLTALVLRDLDRLDESLSVFARIRLTFPETPESLAAGISEIELSIETGRTEEIPETTSYFNSHMGKPEWYVSARFRPEQFRSRFVAAGREMLDRKLFDVAVEYGNLLPSICTLADKSRLLAEAHLRQAEEIAMQGGQLQDYIGIFRPTLKGEVLEEARPHYLLAAENFHRLAKEEMRGPEFTELLWKAIECYHAAHDLEQCDQLLDSYMNYESRAKRPRAMLAKGENFLSVGKVDAALASFRQLVEFYPDNPLAYRARLFSANALVERLDFDGATEMLMANLYDGRLTPESPLWRESLFELGNLQYRRGDILQLDAKKLADQGADATLQIQKLEESFQQFQVGIKRLEEALARFGDDPRGLQTRYLVAQAYRFASQLPDTELKMNRVVVEDKRRQKVQQRRELLVSAKNAYGEIRKQINASDDALELDESKQSLLRNAYFGEADLMFELGDYAQALTAYRNVANRYLNDPEALEAMMQIRECFLRLGDEKEANQTLQRAKQTLKRIPASKDLEFTKVTRFDRQQWERVLQ